MSTIDQKKNWAKQLFAKGQMTQKDIAAIVKVTEKTISKWINKENWELLKTSVVISKEQELRRIYQQIHAINNAIEEREKKFATSAEADTISKLASAAQKLESENSVADIINVSIELTEFVKESDPSALQGIINLFDSFIQHKLTR